MKLRAVQFIVTPVLVADDGETLTPVPAEPITVPASAWPTFATDQWPKALAEAEAQLNADA